jgi:hypothetical protein
MMNLYENRLNEVWFSLESYLFLCSVELPKT